MMKKSQILAAIALAMALGVVAPVVSAENASAALPAGSEAAKLVDSEVAKMEAAFGKVETYEANGSKKVNDGYAYYGTAAEVIKNAKKVITDSQKDEIVTLTGTKAVDGGAAATAGYKAIDAAVGIGVLTADEATKITSTTGWGTDYDKTLELLNGVKTKLAAVKDTDGIHNTDQETAAKAAIAVIDNAIKTANDNINADVAVTPVADGAVDKAMKMVKALTNETVEDPKTAAELNAIIAKIEGELPKMPAYLRVQKELDISGIDEATFDTTGLSEQQIKQLIANMWAAYNGTTITTPSDQIVGDKNDGVNAPATGIAGTAEGTATTVSIVAGLATALTALGAGVVAYRSARRK